MLASLSVRRYGSRRPIAGEAINPGDARHHPGGRPLQRGCDMSVGIDVEAATKQSKERGFEEWLGRQETKLILSLLPPSQNETQRECLRSLLQSAFDAGHNGGQVVVVSSLMNEMTKGRR
jgi:hypothetical protein